jgi:hypothetical protein
VPGRTLDGRDLTAVMQGTESFGDRTVLIQAGPPSRLNHLPWYFRGVRTDRYTFVRWQGGRRFTELYDRVRDPFQMKNVAKDRRYRAVRRELARRTTDLGGCRGSGCYATYPPLPAPGH